MKKYFKNLVIACLIVTMAAGLSGCGSKADKEINKTLDEFQYSCQNLDVKAMLDCVNPDVADPIRFGFALISQFTETEYEDIVDCLFDGLLSGEFGEEFDCKEFLNTINLSEIEIDSDGNHADVSCKLNFELAGQEFSRPTKIGMIQVDEKWYIDGLDLFSATEEEE